MPSKFISIIVGVVIILLAIVAVVLYRPVQPVPSPTPTATAQGVYEDDMIKFSYPAEWGEARSSNGELTFSQNSYIHGVWSTTGEDFEVTCPQPKVIQNNRYCRIFTNDHEYLYEQFIRGGAGISQDAITRNFFLSQPLPEETSLESILDRTAPADVLAKIDAFEQVMLSLEVK